MLYLIDGSGDCSKEVYRQDMSSSFINKINRDYESEYFRGPSDFDICRSSKSIAEDVVKSLRSDKRFKKEDLFLAGHSRGGYIALIIAKILSKETNIKSIFLFDAVDRSLLPIEARVIPPNVGHVYHAKRQNTLSEYVGRAAVERAEDKYCNCVVGRPGAGRATAALLADVIARGPPTDGRCLAEWQEMRRTQEEDLKFRWAMRSNNLVFPEWFRKKYPNSRLASGNFGNCLDREKEKGNPRYTVDYFLGSHGAMGGTPIVDPEAKVEILTGDKAAVKSVWSWMSPFFEAEGLKKRDPRPGTFVEIMRGTKPVLRSSQPRPGGAA